MEKKRVTTKIWHQSLHQLKVIAAIKNESMIDTLSRLIETEYKQVQRKDQEDARDTGIQDRTGPE